MLEMVKFWSTTGRWVYIALHWLRTSKNWIVTDSRTGLHWRVWENDMLTYLAQSALTTWRTGIWQCKKPIREFCRSPLPISARITVCSLYSMGWFQHRTCTSKLARCGSVRLWNRWIETVLTYAQWSAIKMQDWGKTAELPRYGDSDVGRTLALGYVVKGLCHDCLCLVESWCVCPTLVSSRHLERNV